MTSTTPSIDRFFHSLHFHDVIWVIRYSLKYEPNPPVFYEVPRWRYEAMKKQERMDKYRDSYLERVSQSRFESEQRKDEIERMKKAYNSAIMKKYNVDSNWRNNRWFTEQVRPHL
jgi:hypothetical protein